MKKTFSIFLILSFLFNAAGYLLIYSVLQSHLKEIAEEKISASKLENRVTILAFSKSDINDGRSQLKFIDEKEFSYKGKMYDIITEKIVNDSIYFECFSDIDEDELNLAFNKNFDGDENGDKNSSTQNLQKNILQDGVLSNDSILILQSKKISYYTNNSISTPSNIYEAATPPPVSLFS